MPLAPALRRHSQISEFEASQADMVETLSKKKKKKAQEKNIKNYFIYFYFLCMSICLNVCLYIPAMPGCVEARRGHFIS